MHCDIRSMKNLRVKNAIFTKNVFARPIIYMYNFNVVESGVKQQKPNLQPKVLFSYFR